MKIKVLCHNCRENDRTDCGRLVYDAWNGDYDCDWPPEAVDDCEECPYCFCIECKNKLGLLGKKTKMKECKDCTYNDPMLEGFCPGCVSNPLPKEERVCKTCFWFGSFTECLESEDYTCSYWKPRV